VLVLDGRGERVSYLAGHAVGGKLRVHALQSLPHSLGLFYEEATEHLGFLRSSDEYKVMALAAYGEPRFLATLRAAVQPDRDGGFTVAPIDWAALAPRRRPDEDWRPVHADLAASVQRRLEEMLLALARWLHTRTGARHLVMAAGGAPPRVPQARPPPRGGVSGGGG